jgi:hypothetical protein
MSESFEETGKRYNDPETTSKLLSLSNSGRIPGDNQEAYLTPEENLERLKKVRELLNSKQENQDEQ